MSSELFIRTNITAETRECSHRGYQGATRAAGWWRSGNRLSPHEARLLTLLVDGHNLRTAAAELGVSRATVAWHMRNIYQKLEAHSKSEAVAKALRSGLIP